MGVHFNRILMCLTSFLLLLFVPSLSLAQAFTLNSSSQDLSTVASGQVIHFTTVWTANQNLSGVSLGNQIFSLSTNEMIGENWVSHASIAAGQKITLTFAFTVPSG